MLRELLDNKPQGESPGSILNTLRLPGRLSVEQTAKLLGVPPHDIPRLVHAGLLKVLGSGRKNTTKYFASVDVEEKARNPQWLDRATKALSRVSASGATAASKMPGHNQ